MPLTRGGVGHIVFYSDPVVVNVGVSVGVGIGVAPWLIARSFLAGETILSKLAKTYYWEMHQKLITFGDITFVCYFNGLLNFRNPSLSLSL